MIDGGFRYKSVLWKVIKTEGQSSLGGKVIKHFRESDGDKGEISPSGLDVVKAIFVNYETLPPTQDSTTV